MGEPDFTQNDDGFLQVTPVSSTNKTGHQDITQILLKVALNTRNLNQKDDLKSAFIMNM
jgi:hypothetical protein